MSFEVDNSREVLRGRYAAVKAARGPLLDQMQSWVDRATQLHTDAVVQAEKDEILALRAELIAQLRTILGI